jgi:PAS domain S-box-containing protein
MASLTLVAEFVGYALILLTALGAADAVIRRHDTHRINIFAFVTVLPLSGFLRHPASPILWASGTALQLALPYFLLRMTRQFRDISRSLLHGSLIIAIAVSVVLTATRGIRPPIVSVIVGGYVAVLFLYVAGLFIQEARHTAGVTARRLSFAAVASWIFVFGFGLVALAGLVPAIAGWLPLARITVTAALACYFVAFSTPRWLKGQWQRAEQARYLTATADRDAEERGAHAANDLLHTVTRSVGHSLVLVALRPATASDDVVVREATDRAWVGQKIGTTGGVVGRAVQHATPELARPADCAADLASRCAALGERVLVAPIVTTSRVWGVVIVVQRRGSLFPEDDLQLLGQVSRYAATALDHAGLIADARERERRRADRRLQAAESRLGLMLESIRDYAMFVIDPDGLVVMWPAGAAHLFEYTSDEITGDSASPLFNLLPSQLLARLQEARQVGRAQWEGPARRKSGDRFLAATVIRPLAGEADLPGFVAVTRDLTEQRDLEERLRQSQKMEAVGHLAGGIAHDFNNMLLAILGYTDLLAQDARGDAPKLELIAAIQQSADRATGLTRQLLAFGRRQVLQRTTVNLSGLVGELMPMLRRVIAEHIDVVADVSADVPAVLGDRSQLEQVVVNLAVNARDAMPSGGRVTFRTRTEWLDSGRTGGEAPPGPFAMLEVVDTGIGMTPETQQRIFEPFFTTKPFGQGTGLGLATVYGIVKQMGGFIRVESEPGLGATFRIYLPETRERETPRPWTPTPTPPGGDETLLLVEDDSAVRHFLVRTLEKHGYRVLSAEHPTVALQLMAAHTGPIDLVITDVVLPGMMGPEFVRALEAERGEATPVPVLYISGYADGSPGWQGEPPQGLAFLQKPFSAADLLIRIREVLAPL